MSYRDFALEGTSKASLQKAFEWMGNRLGYDLIDQDNRLQPGCNAIVFVPPGANTTGIPEDGGWIFTGPFTHERGTYDENGNELTPPNLSTNWIINMRLTGIPYSLDTVANPIDNFHESTIRAAIDSLGASLSRPSENGSDTNPVSYWEYDLGGGDFLRLYWGDNALKWKNVWLGGNVETVNPV